MKKYGFTMIELLFIIVILGILAGIGIPKLSATRDDAKEAITCNNIATCITDMAALYTATQNAVLTNSVACSDSTVTSIVTLDAGGSSITVNSSPSMCTDIVGPYTFGGSRISF